VADELVQAKLLRAIYSDRQLEEVMTDFWFNHFNIFSGKGPERLFLTNYEQEVIRSHALGKFEDLLVATAKSPAMLFYLDNWLSVGPDSMRALGIPAHPARNGPRRFPTNPNAKRKANNGLNENYGRELLELHTLSVNGGYSTAADSNPIRSCTSPVQSLFWDTASNQKATGKTKAGNCCTCWPPARRPRISFL
jgi:uncharacterized protein (DUF1800 family)